MDGLLVGQYTPHMRDRMSSTMHRRTAQSHPRRDWRPGDDAHPTAVTDGIEASPDDQINREDVSRAGDAQDESWVLTRSGHDVLTPRPAAHPEALRISRTGSSRSHHQPANRQTLTHLLGRTRALEMMLSAGDCDAELKIRLDHQSSAASRDTRRVHSQARASRLRTTSIRQSPIRRRITSAADSDDACAI
jgi:hypothetical protein